MTEVLSDAITAPAALEDEATTLAAIASMLRDLPLEGRQRVLDRLVGELAVGSTRVGRRQSDLRHKIRERALAGDSSSKISLDLGVTPEVTRAMIARLCSAGELRRLGDGRYGEPVATVGRDAQGGA